MSLLDAAIQVLEEADNPLRAKEITERILSKGLWKTSGKTPAATVSARLYSDIKKREKTHISSLTPRRPSDSEH